jgi:hypothetical protein
MLNDEPDEDDQPDAAVMRVRERMKMRGRRG